MRPFAPVSLRPGQAALLASVANHGRKPFSPQTAFTGSLLPAPTNPGDITAPPGFGWSHNSSFKPTPCRGVSRVLCATLAHVRRPATGRLNSGVRRQKSAWWLCFPMLPFPASVSTALRSVSCGVASSVKSVCRAHTSHALRSSASASALSFVRLLGFTCCHF